jgi:hypothetical protein
MVRHPTKYQSKRIAVGASATSALTTSGTTITFNHTVEANSNMCLFVSVILLSGANSVSGVTYNGVSMTLGKAQVDDATAFDLEIWYLAAPALGTNQVVVTTANSMSTSSQGQAVAFAMANVNSLVADTGASTSTGTSLTSILASITPSNPHAMMLDVVGLNAQQTVTFGETQTLIADVQIPLGLDSGTMSIAYQDGSPSIEARNYSASWSVGDSAVQIVLAIRRG